MSELIFSISACLLLAGVVGGSIYTVTHYNDIAWRRGYKAGWNAAWDEDEGYDPDPDDGEPIPEGEENVVYLNGRRAA